MGGGVHVRIRTYKWLCVALCRYLHMCLTATMDTNANLSCGCNASRGKWLFLVHYSLPLGERRHKHINASKLFSDLSVSKSAFPGLSPEHRIFISLNLQQHFIQLSTVFLSNTRFPLHNLTEFLSNSKVAHLSYLCCVLLLMILLLETPGVSRHLLSSTLTFRHLSFCQCGS